MDQKQIVVSRASSAGRGNQVIERTFRTIKGIIKKQLNLLPKQKMIPLSTTNDFTTNSTLVTKAIEQYNNKPHKSLFGMTPNQMEEALVLYNKTSSDTERVPALVKNITTSIVKNNNNQLENDYVKVIRYKLDAVDKYTDIQEWKKVVLNFMPKIEEGVNQLREVKNLSKNQFNIILDLNKKISDMNEEMNIMKEARLEKEKRILKRKNIKSQALRDSINEAEFTTTLQSIKQNHFVPSRRKAALILLYVTGLRVSNLLKFKVKHINDFLDKGDTFIELIKKGSKKHSLSLSLKSLELIKQFHDNFGQLMKDKQPEQYLFTTQVQFDRPINRSSFDHELNQILIKASQRFHKHIRTHSFRATIITDFLKSTPIDVVKEIIGHKDIKTTLQYKRGAIDPMQVKRVLSNLDKERYNITQSIDNSID